MQISSLTENGIAILSLDGRLNQASADSLHAAAMTEIDNGCSALIVDMSGVDYIASVGIRALIRPSQAIKLKGGKLAVSNLRPEIRDFFSLTGLDQMFDVHPSTQEAIASLSNPPQ